MTTAIYLEHYLESLESLPVELQRNFKLMRDLDGRAQSIMQEIDLLGDEFLRSSSTSSSEKKKELTAKIQKLFNKAKEYGDDKVQLAIQTYELVDKHIRRLDSDLARFESEIKNGTVTGALSPQIENTPPATNKRGRKREKESKKVKGAEVAEDKTSKLGSASPARKKHKSEIQLVAEQAAAGGSSGEVLDMPVDPNEPTYCICHQVSYGQMIACDNPECPIEWFHIVCMGLNSIPKGKWYCPKCQPLRKTK
jgi:inhibitor of growth protein 4